MEENKSGREEEEGVQRREVAMQTRSAWKRKQWGACNTPETLSKSDNFRGEGNAERGESEHARAKPPPKSRQRGGLLEVVIHPPRSPASGCRRPPFPSFLSPLGSLDSRTGYTALPVLLDVRLYLRKDFCAYTYPNLGTRLRVKLSRAFCIINSNTVLWTYPKCITRFAAWNKRFNNNRTLITIGKNWNSILRR